MYYPKKEAKAYAKSHFTGVWAANLTPFDADLRFDELAYQANLKHWFDDLGLAGMFVGGKQAEGFSLSIVERKRLMLLSVEATHSSAALATAQKNGRGRPQIVTSCSDPNLDTVLELVRYSEQIGADYVIVHSPVFHFGADTEETIFEYYRYIAEQTRLGVAMWNHPDCGYVMSPELCAKIARIPNIVAIKYSTDRDRYQRLTELVGSDIQVSNPSEEDWLDHIVELKWQLYLCSTPPFLLQTKVDQRMNEYTRLAFAGDYESARRISDSLQPVRDAFKVSKPKGKPQAHAKYWMELLGQRGGPVRRPLLQLTESERELIRVEFARSGLKL